MGHLFSFNACVCVVECIVYYPHGTSAWMCVLLCSCVDYLMNTSEKKKPQKKREQKS